MKILLSIKIRFDQIKAFFFLIVLFIIQVYKKIFHMKFMTYGYLDNQ